MTWDFVLGFLFGSMLLHVFWINMNNLRMELYQRQDEIIEFLMSLLNDEDYTDE